MNWLNRNLILLIGGVVLLPLSLYALLMWLAFGYGFAQEQSAYASIIIVLLVSFPIIYMVSVRLAMKQFKKQGSYGYWDLIPIFYFALGFLILFWPKF